MAASKQDRAGAGRPVTGDGPEVAIVGGGIAGLTAAIRLAKAGFAVTLFEKDDRLGGNTSSECINGVEHDVYPHMFCEWYVNFWHLFEHDLGLDRAEHFAPRPGVKMLREGASSYIDLLNPTSLDAIFANLKSGALSPGEMLLVGFSMLDLAGHPFDAETVGQLNRVDVNGFLASRGYATEQVAEMENYFLQLIWSIDSDRTAAVTYQDFLRHTLSFPNHAPFAHMLRGSLNDRLIAPIAALLERLGVTVHLGTEVTAARLVDGRPQLHWRAGGGKGRLRSATFAEAILAVPSGPLTTLVFGADDGLPGKTLVAAEPELAQVRRLAAVPIPVVDLYLKRQLAGFPVESIGLQAAQYGLSVVDIAQLWPAAQFDGKSALVIAASNGAALPATTPDGIGRAILEEFVRFYPEIDIGTAWGDPDCDIDWSKTAVRANTDYPLFLNDVGSWRWRPKASYPQTLPGFHFAGDLARSDIDMATVEGAVESGLVAAAAVQAADAAAHGGKTRGEPIAVIRHTTYGDAALRGAKIVLLPFAYGAAGWAAYRKAKAPGGAPQLSEPLLLLPLQFALDWWTTVYWFWRAVADRDATGGPGTPDDDYDDRFIGLGAAILMVLGEYASWFAEHCLPPQQAGTGPATLAGQLGRLAAGAASRAGDAAGEKHYRRRWRAKS